MFVGCFSSESGPFRVLSGRKSDFLAYFEKKGTFLHAFFGDNGKKKVVIDISS